MPGHDKVTPQGKDFFKQIEELKKLQVRVGFTANGKGFGQQHQDVDASDYKEGPSIAEVAAWNELGTAHSPPRPFIRQSVDKNGARIAAMCKQQIAAIVKGEATAEKALKAIGALQVGLIQAEIKTGGFEPNAPITIEGGWMHRNGKSFYIKGKKSTQPLIDTGRLRQSIHYIIEQKGDD